MKLGGISLHFDETSTRWKAQAACHGKTALFHPGKFDYKAAAAAKAICEHDCPVRWECLRFAIENAETEGIWGGMGIKGRRAVKRRIRNGELTLRNDGLHFDIKR